MNGLDLRWLVTPTLAPFLERSNPNFTGQIELRLASDRQLSSDRLMPPVRQCFGSGHWLHETISAQAIHLVEWPDVRHTIVDLALWRTGRHGRAGQYLLSHQGTQDRSDTRLRAPLGDLQRGRRGFARAAVMAWLAASHRRYRPDRTELHAARL